MTTAVYARMKSLIRLRDNWRGVVMAREAVNASHHVIANAKRNMETVRDAARDLYESGKCGPKTKQLYEEHFNQ